MLAAALGVYWIAAPREASPEELYRQYMELSPFEQFDQKEKLLKKAAQAGCVPAMRQMADHNFISKNDLKVSGCFSERRLLIFSRRSFSIPIPLSQIRILI